jgi:hypothetical protein
VLSIDGMSDGAQFRCVLTFLPARTTCSVSTPRNDFYKLNAICKAALTASGATTEDFSDDLNLGIGDMLSRPLSLVPCARLLMVARQLHGRTRCSVHPLMLTSPLHARSSCCLRAIPLMPARPFRARPLMFAHQLPAPLLRARSCCSVVLCAHPLMLTRVPVHACSPVQHAQIDEGWCH